MVPGQLMVVLGWKRILPRQQVPGCRLFVACGQPAPRVRPVQRQRSYFRTIVAPLRLVNLRHQDFGHAMAGTRVSKHRGRPLHSQAEACLRPTSGGFLPNEFSDRETSDGRPPGRCENCRNECDRPGAGRHHDPCGHGRGSHPHRPCGRRLLQWRRQQARPWPPQYRHRPEEARRDRSPAEVDRRSRRADRRLPPRRDGAPGHGAGRVPGTQSETGLRPHDRLGPERPAGADRRP
ncbi:hypothetical protein D3C76_618830 [compost metagenome]